MKRRSSHTKIRRYIGPKILGRALKSNEEIHHIDENPFNNDHNNLIICSGSYHRGIHGKLTRKKNVKIFGSDVKSMLEEGYSIRHISEILKVNKRKIENVMKDLGLKRTKSEAERLKWDMRGMRNPRKSR